jgi:hypothetical protein
MGILLYGKINYSYSPKKVLEGVWGNLFLKKVSPQNSITYSITK